MAKAAAISFADNASPPRPSPDRLPPSRLRGILWRKRVTRSLLEHTGLLGILIAVSNARRHIEVTRHRVFAPVDTPTTVAVLADLHVARAGALERDTLAVLRRERPDLILIAGDVTSIAGNDRVYRQVLEPIRAPRGVWMVRGNWDYWAPMENAEAVCAAAGIRVLDNEAAEIEPGVWLTGIDDHVAGHPDPSAALARVPRNAWVMALFHCPITFDSIAGRCALAFAGHTHGRHFRFFGLRPRGASAGGGRYEAGWYDRDGSRLYVSRGLAKPGGAIRLFGQPEIALFTLTREP
jgi:predicted MPP superfamily phosphohydrolase